MSFSLCSSYENLIPEFLESCFSSPDAIQIHEILNPDGSCQPRRLKFVSKFSGLAWCHFGIRMILQVANFTRIRQGAFLHTLAKFQLPTGRAAYDSIDQRKRKRTNFEVSIG